MSLKLSNRCIIPPHPAVVAEIKREFDEAKKSNPEIDMRSFLREKGIEPGYTSVGKDNPAKVKTDSLRTGVLEMEKIDVPTFRPTGDVNVLGLLVDFEDNKGVVTSEHYKDMLFSEGTYLTGSMRDYYKEVSYGKVKIVGQISRDWLPLPRRYSYYVGNESGGDESGYPHNAQRMVEDAVSVALKEDNSIQWDKYDINENGMVDALFIIHAGPGAEVQMTAEERAKHIWSHKWAVQRPVNVTDKTKVVQYMTVPEDGLLGVFAHETGHLVFGWPDLYDACESLDRTAGLGDWCLMAAGSWNNGGLTPAYPNAWCRHAQGWTNTMILKGKRRIQVPTADASNKVFLLRIKDGSNEYFMVEGRKKSKFDEFVPGEGMLVYHIDEGQENNCEESHLAVGVVQADGEKNLQRLGLFGNQGDDGDPYPGSKKRTYLSSRGFPNSRDYNNESTRISIRGIKWNGKVATANVTSPK